MKTLVHLLLVWILLLLQACTSSPKVENRQQYDNLSRQHLYALRQWSFEGRMAITSPDDSWSASVEWQHEPNLDTINLSGPLGQGAVVIKLAADSVTVDEGDGKLERSNDPDLFVMHKLGVFVPVRALAYWVIGLPDPERLNSNNSTGFEQDNWRISYKEWQAVANQQLPRRVDVQNEKVKLKLVFDQWKVVNE